MDAQFLGEKDFISTAKELQTFFSSRYTVIIFIPFAFALTKNEYELRGCSIVEKEGDIQIVDEYILHSQLLAWMKDGQDLLELPFFLITVQTLQTRKYKKINLYSSLQGIWVCLAKMPSMFMKN
jgi:hypothetical protein